MHMKKKQKDYCTLFLNKGTSFHYDISDEIVGGVMLTGAEAKSLRMKNGSLKGAWASFKDDRLFLKNLQIRRYEHDSGNAHSPMRDREVLLKKSEIEHLQRTMQEKSLQLVPLKIFTKGRWIKVSLGLGRTRKKVDKRNVIKDREIALRTRKLSRRF